MTLPSASRLVILDRDGVIYHDSDAYIKSLAERIPYLSAIEAISLLIRTACTVLIATNHSGVARGYYDVATLDAMHDELERQVTSAGGEIAHIAYCPHGPDDNCRCRKPLPGLLEEIRQRLQLATLEGSWIVGDSLRDRSEERRVGKWRDG